MQELQVYARQLFTYSDNQSCNISRAGMCTPRFLQFEFIISTAEKN